MQSPLARALPLVLAGLLAAACASAPVATSDGVATGPTAVASAADPAAPPPPTTTASPRPPAQHDGSLHAHDDIAPVDLPTGIDPGRVEIPAIDVDAPIIDIGMKTSTEMEVPDRPEEVGWFDLSRRPGEIGPAILAGHVDWTDGPAVFFRLRELRPGDEIVVSGADGDVRTFVVEDVGQYPKDALPDEVFGFGQPRPELRLITCGGDFDRASGHYRDNVVVYARLAGDDAP